MAINGHQGSGTITLINSTLSGNSSTRGGGGIANTSGGVVELLNTTLSGNTQQNEGGGGLLQQYGGTVSMINTVIANSVGSNDCALLGGVFSAHTNNLVEDGSCNAGAVNFLSGDPLLGPLQANGGFTLTHAVLAGSPLIDAGDATACNDYPADQRGVGRPQDGNYDWVATCDIGSFELSGNFLFRNGFEADGN